MKLENQVCSLDLAKKLKELGVKQESLFWYKLYGWNVPDAEFELLYGDPWNYENKFINPEVVSVFTVAELGEMFNNCERGNFLKAYQNLMDLPDEYFDNKYHIGEISVNLLINPDWLAKMLIYLLENKLIKL